MGKAAYPLASSRRKRPIAPDMVEDFKETVQVAYRVQFFPHSSV